MAGSPRLANPAPLLDIARHAFLPEDMASTRYYELIAPQLPGMGIAFDQWQEDMWYAGLSLRADGSLCCDVMGVTLSIARQAGKTYGVMVGLVAICLSRPGTTVVWTSHHDRTSSETLEKIAGIVERPEIRPKMRAQFPVVRTDDGRGVHFANGSRILFGARASGFGRGFAEVDIQVYDEAQYLIEAALTDMLAAMNVSDLGLAFFMGTPPRPKEIALGVHEAFSRRRTRALDPKKKRPYKGVYIEFSPENADGLVAELVADIDHPDFWELLSQANPSFGFRVGRSAIERLVENMSAEDVMREVFGIWTKTVESSAAVDRQAWAARVDDGEGLGAIAALGINADRTGRFFVSAAWRAEDSAHVELAWSSQSEAETLRFVKALASKRTPIKHDSTGAASAVGKQLKAEGFTATAYTLAEATEGNALLVAMTHEGRLSHAGQADLDRAIRSAKRTERKAGGWLLEPRHEKATIGPAIATAAALYAAMTTKQRTGKASF